MLKKIITLPSLFLLIFFIIFSIPYNQVPFGFETCLSLFRILYFSIFIFYLWKLKEFSIIQYGDNFKEFNLLTNTLIFVSFLIAIGLFTQFFSIVHFLLYLYLYRKSKANYFGIEQAYHQICGIFFIFANSNLKFSFDQFFEISNLFVFNDKSSLNFLILSISICLISGFYEKMKSNVWTSGKALKIFLNLPHVKKTNYNNFFSKLISLKALCYIALINQALLFFLYFENLRILFYFGELVFSILLILIAPFHFIGETFILIFTFLISLDILGFVNNSHNFFSTKNISNFYYLDLFLGLLLVNSFLSIFFNLPIFLRNINRYTLGLYPFAVYTEVHIYGIRVFKVSGHLNEKQIYNNLFHVYNEKGYVGPKQKWMPRIIHALTYRISDVCEKRLKKIDQEKDSKVLINLFKNIIHQNNDKIPNINKLKLYIKTINPNYENKNLEEWIDKDWQEIAEYNNNKDKPFSWTNFPTVAKRFHRLLN